MQYCSTPLTENHFYKIYFPRAFVNCTNEVKLLSNSDIKYKQVNENWFKKLMVEFCVQISD